MVNTRSKTRRDRDVPGADADADQRPGAPTHADQRPGAPTPETGIIAGLRSTNLTTNVWRDLNKVEKFVLGVFSVVFSVFLAATILRFLATSTPTADLTLKTPTEPEWTDDGACLEYINSTAHVVLCPKPPGGFVLPGDWEEEAADDGTEPGE